MRRAIKEIVDRLASPAPLAPSETWDLLGLLVQLDQWAQREIQDLLARKDQLEPWEQVDLKALRDHEVRVAKRAIQGRRGLPDPQDLFPPKPKP